MKSFHTNENYFHKTTLIEKYDEIYDFALLGRFELHAVGISCIYVLGKLMVKWSILDGPKKFIRN
jgi:hypothetical protein